MQNFTEKLMNECHGEWFLSRFFETIVLKILNVSRNRMIPNGTKWNQKEPNGTKWDQNLTQIVPKIVPDETL